MRSRNSKSAGLACLLAAAAAFAQSTPPPASVAGDVRNSVSGEPIERVRVLLLHNVNGNWEQYGTYTNAEGKFVILNLPAGDQYSMTSERTGFVTPPGEAAGQFGLQNGERRDNVKLLLTPTGAITGHVLDADGSPVEGITVEAGRGGMTAISDDRGMFRLGGLRPGKFRVKAEVQHLPLPPEIRTDGTVEVQYATTYYPSALDARSASVIEVGPGAEVTSIDIRLVRTRIMHITGKVLGRPPGSPHIAISISPTNLGAQVRADGTFEFWRLDPGKYVISARVFGPDGPQLGSAPLDLEVGESDIENLSLQLLEASEIHGRVEFEQDAPAQPVQPPGLPSDAPRPALARRISFRGSNGSVNGANQPLGEDNSFTLHQVWPGKYTVTISGGGVYVKSMQLGPTSFDGAQLDLSSGSGGAALTVRVAVAKGVVSGVVHSGNGPAVGARVILAEDTAGRPALRVTNAKEDGSYVFNGVAPGKYQIFATDEGAMAFWTNEANAEEKNEIAEKIEVREQETVSQDLKRQ
jgi:protocatechuate 3,4-dioxygenase beta subunit